MSGAAGIIGLIVILTPCGLLAAIAMHQAIARRELATLRARARRLGGDL